MPVVLGALLLVSGAASAQVTGRQLSAMAGLYQVRAMSAGVAFGCLRPQDTMSMFETMLKLFDLPEGSDERAEYGAHIDREWNSLEARGLCSLIGVDVVVKRWDSDEDYPDLIGVRLSGWGGATGRVYWTRKAWLEPAE